MIDANRFRRGHPEQPRRPKAVWHDWTTLRDEGSLQRPLSQAERICIAVAHAEPTHAITLTSKDLDHDGAAKAFAVWLKQINRLRTRPIRSSTSGPLPNPRKAREGLISISLPGSSFRRAWVRDRAGFGRGHIRYLADPGTLRFERFVPVTYALGQHESVFGSTNHRSNEPLPKNKRAHLVPSGINHRSGAAATFVRPSTGQRPLRKRR